MMHTFYAVFDTNVLVPALMSKRADSPTVLLLDYVLDGRIVLLYNEDIIREYEEVLHRDKFAFDEYSIQNLIELVKTGLHLDPTESGEIFADKDDRVFYEVVMEKRKEEDAYLITGNIRHFPMEPFVVTPRQMLDIILHDNSN